MESQEQNSQYLRNIVFLRRSIWVFLEFIRRWTQHFTKIDQEKLKNWTNLHLEHHHYRIYYVNTDLSSVWNFYHWVADIPLRETSLSGDEQGETSAVRRLTMNYVYKNSFRKVKLRRNGKRSSKSRSPSFNISLAVHVVYPHGQGRFCRYSRQLKLNSELCKKESEEISIYSFRPIRSTE